MRSPGWRGIAPGRAHHHLDAIGTRFAREPKARWPGLIDRSHGAGQRHEPLDPPSATPKAAPGTPRPSPAAPPLPPSYARAHPAPEADTFRHVDAPHPSMRNQPAPYDARERRRLPTAPAAKTPPIPQLAVALVCGRHGIRPVERDESRRQIRPLKCSRCGLGQRKGQRVHSQRARSDLRGWREPAVFQLFPLHGRGGFRTCDLSRVKRALSH
jgi:hypothetical protein